MLLLPDRGSPTLTGWWAPVAQHIQIEKVGIGSRGSLEPPSHLQKTLIRSKVVLPATGCALPPRRSLCRVSIAPLVIVSTALHAFYPMAPASPRCGASTEKARSLHRIYGYTRRGTHSILTHVTPKAQTDRSQRRHVEISVVMATGKCRVWMRDVVIKFILVPKRGRFVGSSI